MLLNLKTIAVLVFCIIECNARNGRLSVKRGDQDIFENPNCLVANVTGCNCDGLNAGCVSSTCTKCRCFGSDMTFISSTDKYGHCVKNNYLQFFPDSKKSFLVHRNTSEVCITYNKYKLLQMNPYTYYVKKTICNRTDPTQRWMWTYYNQLLNMDTLKCLQNGNWFSFGQHYLILEECNITEANQAWQCIEGTKINFKLQKSKRYMLYRRDSDYILGAIPFDNLPGIIWQRFQSGENLCSQAFGCYEFVNPPSAILITDVRNCNQQCKEEREIAAPHEFETRNCFILWEQLQFLDHNEWKRLPFKEKIFTISKHGSQVFLKWDFSKASNKWVGLIIKLEFYCAQKPTTQLPVNTRCILIKFKETDVYPMTSITDAISTPKYTTKAKTDERPESAIAKKQQRTSNVTIIFVVCLVITIVIFCGILGLIFCKQRRRSGSNYNGESSVTEPSVTAQNPIFHSHSEIEETYQEPQTDESYECELCEYGENHVHHYAKFGQNGNKMHLKNETYDYVTKGGRQLPIKAQIHHHSNNNSNHKQLSNNSIKSDECEFCESGEKHVHHHAKVGQNGNMPHLKEERYDYAINEGMRLPLKARIHYHSTNNNQKVSSGSIESDECELCESGEKHVHHYAKVEQNKSKPPLKKETFDYATNEEMHLPSGGQIHQHSNDDYRKVSNNSTETGQEMFSYKEEEADVKCLVYQNQAAGESHGTHFYHVLAGP